MQLSSPIFKNDEMIPKKFGYKHGNFSPPLMIADVPKNSKSLVLIMDDPDALDAVGKVWTHWVLWNISPNTKTIGENSIPQNSIQGLNDFGQVGYGGPAPPDKEHTYVFTLYSLDCNIENNEGSTKNEILNSINTHVLKKAQLFGKFSP